MTGGLHEFKEEGDKIHFIPSVSRVFSRLSDVNFLTIT